MGIDTTRSGEVADGSERPKHPVLLDRYCVGAFLVTNKLFYDAFPYATDRRNEYSRDEHQPVNNVSWYEAQVFAWWIGCDLATDAEWEFRLRGVAADDDVLNNLTMLPSYAWYGANSNNTTHATFLLQSKVASVHGSLHRSSTDSTQGWHPCSRQQLRAESWCTA